MKANLDSQPSLWDAPPRQTHSETSTAAAEQIEPKAGTLRALVMDAIYTCGKHGATDEELQEALQMDPSTERPRRVELVRAGLVRDSGMTRPTNSGRRAVVWVTA